MELALDGPGAPAAGWRMARTLHQSHAARGVERTALKTPLTREGTTFTIGGVIPAAGPNKAISFSLQNGCLIRQPLVNCLQFTKRRRRTLLTSPNIINVESVLEPPALISGRGIPVTGIRPITIPTFTST